jgi:hypothetical protein
MIHNHSTFRKSSGMPPPMNYVIMFLGQPVFADPNWLNVHRFALEQGYAVNALGCIFTKMPGVTIKHPRSY